MSNSTKLNVTIANGTVSVTRGKQYKPDLSNVEFYKMSHKKNGRAVIFNQRMSSKNAEYTTSAKDSNDMKNVLTKLGFMVDLYEGLTISEIMEKLSKLSEENHSDNDCLIIVVLTHGGAGGMINASDGRFKVNDLHEYFHGHNCPSLKEKPKLFFVDACRGTFSDPGTELEENSVHENSLNPPVFIPTLADILILYSSAENYYSHGTNEGSWFIRSLINVLEDFCHEELMTILQRVNWKTAYECIGHTEQGSRVKQMPCIMSMLTKSFYFVNKED